MACVADWGVVENPCASTAKKRPRVANRVNPPPTSPHGQISQIPIPPFLPLARDANPPTTWPLASFLLQVAQLPSFPLFTLMDVDASSVPSRLDRGRVGDENATTFPLSAPDRPSDDASRTQLDKDAAPSKAGERPRLYSNDDAVSPRAHRPTASFSLRDPSSTIVANPPRTTGYSALLPSESGDHASPHDAQLSRKHQQPPPHSSNSQGTSTSHESDRIFTPPFSEGGLSNGHGDGQDSSQESQLLQLSQLVAAQEKMPVSDAHISALSRKRMADGAVKHSRERSSASPVFAGGHSRNTSTVSVASTAGSRIGEVSAVVCMSHPARQRQDRGPRAGLLLMHVSCCSSYPPS